MRVEQAEGAEEGLCHRPVPQQVGVDTFVLQPAEHRTQFRVGLAPVMPVVDQRGLELRRLFADDLHIGREIAPRRRVGSVDEVGGLQHGEGPRLANPPDQFPEVSAEGLAAPDPGEAVVHPQQQPHHFGAEPQHPSVECREQPVGPLATHPGVEHHVIETPQLPANAFAKVLDKAAMPLGVEGTVGDAVAGEDPGNGVGPLEQAGHRPSERAFTTQWRFGLRGGQRRLAGLVDQDSPSSGRAGGSGSRHRSVPSVGTCGVVRSAGHHDAQ